MSVVKQEKIIEHPLESIFDIEPMTTPVEYNAIVPDEVIPTVGYDDKDNEIEGKLEEIYARAMGQVGVISDEIERVEGKYKARMSEVSATMLNVALSAVREKSQLKQHKDKLGVTAKAAGTPNTLNQTMIVADRNEILRALGDKINKG